MERIEEDYVKRVIAGELDELLPESLVADTVEADLAATLDGDGDADEFVGAVVALADRVSERFKVRRRSELFRTLHEAKRRIAELRECERTALTTLRYVVLCEYVTELNEHVHALSEASERIVRDLSPVVGGGTAAETIEAAARAVEGTGTLPDGSRPPEGIAESFATYLSGLEQATRFGGADDRSDDPS